MKKSILSLLLIIVLALPLWADFEEEFMQRMQDIEDESQLPQFFRSEANRATDVNEHRIIQSYWHNLEHKQCDSYYKSLLKKHPKNPDYQYLSIRMQPWNRKNPKARQLIAKDPEYYWNYRLLAMGTLEALSSKNTDAYMKKKDTAKDFKLYQEALELFPDDDFLNAAIFAILAENKDYQGAKAALAKVKDRKAIYNLMKPLLRYAINTKDYESYEKILRDHIIKADNEKDLEKFVFLSVANMLSQNASYAELSKYIEKHPEMAKESATNWVIIYNHLKYGKLDDAMDIIEDMLKRETTDWAEIQNRQAYNTLDALVGKPRWQRILTEADKQWKENAPNRREKAANERMHKEAPLWELEGLNDTTVKLENLRGKIVILDFWATWCGPCRSAMPVISEWMREKMPEGVEVFSINTWERNPEDAIDYMAKNDYAMTLLFGNKDIPKLYGFDGIPYICVIDQDGNIAYEEKGFSHDLAEKLSLWVEILLAE